MAQRKTRLEFAVGAEPLTEFTQREPTLAVRVLIDPNGMAARGISAALGSDVE